MRNNFHKDTFIKWKLNKWGGSKKGGGLGKFLKKKRGGGGGGGVLVRDVRVHGGAREYTETLTQVFSEFFEISRNTCFTEHPQWLLLKNV